MRSVSPTMLSQRRKLLWPSVCFSPTHQAILQQVISWVSCNSTQFWCHLPGNSIRSHRLRGQTYQLPPTPKPVASPGLFLPVLLINWLEINFPMTSSSVSTTLLGQLTELRETLLLYFTGLLQRILQRIQMKRWIGQGMWEGAWSFCALSGHTTL